MNRREILKAMGVLSGGVIGIGSLGLASCTFLDVTPADLKTSTQVWTDRQQTEDFLYNIYAAIPTPKMNLGFGFEGISDEMDYTWNVYPSYQINLGNWNPTTSFLNYWATFFKGIRDTFTLENNIGQNKQLSSDLIAQYKAEAKFLRGYLYWRLLRQYGPVPLITQAIPVNDNFNLTRTPFDKIVDYIVQMMTEAQTNLPGWWPNYDPQWIGKADQLTCKAVIAEVLTFAASPMWNGNPAYVNFKNHDGTNLATTSYDSNKWKLAADANLAVIQMASSVGVKLYKNNENGNGATFSPYKSVRDWCFTWNPEIIWGKSNWGPGAMELHYSPGPNNLGGAGPTQRNVDAYFMNNGKWITDPQSGYVENGFALTGDANYKPAGLDEVADRIAIINALQNGDAWGHWPGDWNMYANREPRFYANILYNKRIIPQLPTDVAKRDYYSSVGQQNGYGRVEFYYGGMSRRSGSYTFFPRTGYLALRDIDPHSNLRDRVYADNDRPLTLVRYAKVLLDYIECLNEVDPTNSDIPTYWNQIRERAGIPDIYDVYPEIKGDKVAQREHIIRERQIELAFNFSFDRYFTMKRRLLAGTPDNGDPMRQYGDGGQMWGMNINAGDPKTNNFETTAFYKRVPFETRIFDNKMYLFPIPQSEVDRASNLVQNPGW